MNAVADFLGRALRGLLKLALLVAALVFVVSFLLAALVVVLAMSLWALVTGRKPTPLVVWGRLREQSQRYTQAVWPQRPGAAPPGDVVDVQATEVPERGQRRDDVQTPDAAGRLR